MYVLQAKTKLNLVQFTQVQRTNKLNKEWSSAKVEYDQVQAISAIFSVGLN